MNFVKPRRFRLRMTLTPDTDALPTTGRVCCWLPFPRAFPFQTEIELIASFPDPVWLAHSEEAQRTIYFECPVQSELAFTVEYAYLSYARVCRMDPEKAISGVPPDVRRYTEEYPPHVVFTENMRGLSREIVAGETNPARIAWKLYEWIAMHLKYSYAPEYATLDNISEWVYQRRYGDCGQMALFYITLCRLNGIPARWQSGWMLHPGHQNLHDWCEIYVAPYGWIPVDPNMGVTAWNSRQYTADEKSAVMTFYFGSLDHWRLAANADHGRQHTPPKRSWRTDPVDSQRGELEVDDRTIPFGQFTYQLDILDQTLVQE